MLFFHDVAGTEVADFGHADGFFHRQTECGRLDGVKGLDALMADGSSLAYRDPATVDFCFHAVGAHPFAVPDVFLNDAVVDALLSF